MDRIVDRGLEAASSLSASSARRRSSHYRDLEYLVLITSSHIPWLAAISDIHTLFWYR